MSTEEQLIEIKTAHVPIGGVIFHEGRPYARTSHQQDQTFWPGFITPHFEVVFFNPHAMVKTTAPMAAAKEADQVGAIDGGGNATSSALGDAVPVVMSDAYWLDWLDEAEAFFTRKK